MDVTCCTSHVTRHTSQLLTHSLALGQVTVGTHVVVATEGTELPSGDVVSKVACDVWRVMGGVWRVMCGVWRSVCDVQP